MRWRMTGLLLFLSLGLSTLLLLNLTDWGWRHVLLSYQPLQNNVNQARILLAKGQRSLERMIQGDSSVRRQDILPLFTRANMVVQDALTGHDDRGTIPPHPIDDPMLHKRLEQFHQKIHVYSTTLQSLLAPLNWPNDQQRLNLRTDYHTLEDQADAIDLRMTALINDALYHQRRLYWLTSIALITLFAFSILLTDRAIRTRRQAELALDQSQRQLEKTVTRRTQDLQREIMIKRRIEADLRANQGVLRAILESTRDAILTVDNTGKITQYNLHFKELWNIPDRMMPSDNDAYLLQFIAEQLIDPIPFQTKIKELDHSTEESLDQLFFKDGKIVERYSRPLFQGHTLAGRVWCFSDITERTRFENDLHQAKREAEQANRAKSNFLATMSHEIRTPMNAILGMGELLKEASLTETQHDYLRVLNLSGEALLSLINNILDLSKIEADYLTLEQHPFDLHQLVDETMNLFTVTAQKKAIAFSEHRDPTLPRMVSGDSTRIRQVLLNLVSNALKFSPQGRVEVHVQSGPEETIIFAVQDTGIGIQEDKKLEIFQPFTQADSTTTRDFGGTGLGLAICQRLVTLMGGSLTVESEWGVGSCFTFTVPLPTVSQEATPEPTNEENRSQMQIGCRSDAPTTDQDNRLFDKQHILLVDDSEENRMVVTAYLANAATLTIAENGQEAVERFKQDRFHLVLMDIQMPLMDGYEATRQIRAWEAASNRSATPIIALTAHAMTEESQKTKEAGCNLHLTKPIRKKRLLDVLEQFRS